MNATVARIVEIMFQDTEMNDEVQALKDEVMNNCQERYLDMLARGMDEDEAIAAVVDSLKGMEEVLAQYPSKAAAGQSGATSVDEDGDADCTFAAHTVKQVKVLLTSDDVNFETSMDDMVHVMYNKEEMPDLKVTVRNGVMCIERDVQLNMHNERETADHVTVEVNGKECEYQNLSDVLKGVGKLLNGLRIKIGSRGGDVTVSIPQDHCIAMDLHTTSGDVEVDGIAVSELRVESTSGDLTAELPEDNCPSLVKIKGASGDVDFTGNAGTLSIQTVSGDVDYSGDCPDVTIQTVSGDAGLCGDVQNVNLKTISGDVDMQVEGNLLRQINCKTTSGDLTVHLPAELRGQVAVQMHSVSGDVRNRFGEPLGAAAAQVNMQSVSGDVTLC